MSNLKSVTARSGYIRDFVRAGIAKMVVFVLAMLSIAATATAASVVLKNVSKPGTNIEVGNTVQVEITGAAPFGTVTVDQTKDDVWGGGPVVMGSTDGNGYYSVTATEGADNIGKYTQVWAVNGIAANPTLQFNVYRNYVGGNCPTPSSRRWVWSPVEYFYASVLPSAAITGAASDWNAVQSKISLINVSYFDTDVVVVDNNNLPAGIGARVTTFGQEYGTCLNMRDTCGKCMTSMVMYAADMELNANLLVTAANNYGFDLTSWIRFIVGHEFGHVLRLADVSATNYICSEVQSVMYQHGNVGYLCGTRSPRSCDTSGINQAYPTTVGPWCPCSGVGC